MTARRLRIESSDANAPRAIRDVAAPLRTTGRSHNLAQVLELMLDTAGLSLGYEVVMGLSGLACRTPPWPAEPRLSFEEAVSAAERLGSALEDGLTVCRGAELPAEDLLAQVREVVDAGRPCAALGWGSEKEDWSIICGYDIGRGHLIGHCLLDHPRERYESWPARLEILISLPAAPAPSGREAVERALQLGSSRLVEEAPQRYQTWMNAMLQADAPPSPIQPHEQAVEMLADARSAAATFAAAVARHEDEVASAWLTRAANLWHEMVEILESRGAPHTPEAIAWLDHPEGRRAWATVLERAARLDDRAAVAVKCSLTVDYLPEERYGP